MVVLFAREYCRKPELYMPAPARCQRNCFPKTESGDKGHRPLAAALKRRPYGGVHRVAVRSNDKIKSPQVGKYIDALILPAALCKYQPDKWPCLQTLP